MPSPTSAVNHRYRTQDPLERTLHMLPARRIEIGMLSATYRAHLSCSVVTGLPTGLLVLVTKIYIEPSHLLRTRSASDKRRKSTARPGSYLGIQEAPLGFGYKVAFLPLGPVISRETSPTTFAGSTSILLKDITRARATKSSMIMRPSLSYSLGEAHSLRRPVPAIVRI